MTRKKSLQQAIRDKVDPNIIVDFAIEILSNKTGSAKDRMWAAEFLADRGWGKPSLSVQISDETTPTEIPNLTKTQSTAVLRAYFQSQYSRDLVS